MWSPSASLKRTAVAWYPGASGGASIAASTSRLASGSASEIASKRRRPHASSGSSTITRVHGPTLEVYARHGAQGPIVVVFVAADQ
jgi:hypothetical protein